jgi:hypothetical protein
MQRHQDATYEAVGEVIGELTGKLEKRIKALELQLAETRGALDVLRGRGVAGALRVCGTFDSRTTYCLNDIVAFNGSSWAARRDSPGPIPGDGWQLVASQGKRGPQGERGPTGPAGPPPLLTGVGFSHRGMEIKTKTGDAIPILRSVGVDAEDFSLKFTAPDGSTLKISLLPLFQEFHKQTTG